MAFVDEEMKQIENGCAGMTDGIVWKEDVGGSASLVVVVVDSIQRGHVTRDEAWFHAWTADSAEPSIGPNKVAPAEQVDDSLVVANARGDGGNCRSEFFDLPRSGPGVYAAEIFACRLELVYDSRQTGMIIAIEQD